MRMRKRPNLEPRMEKCRALMISEPEELKGSWARSFPEYSGIFAELGCGKGRFTQATAASLPEKLFVAIEKVPDVMVLAMERVKNCGTENVRFIDGDAAKLTEMFAPGELERLYINFCDPWPKSRDAKFRLTAPYFLRLYASVLPEGGQIHFKTDNTPLFDWSIEQFRAEGWELSELTYDLHENGPVGIMTDYEEKFYLQRFKINRLVATKAGDTKDISAGPVPRLRNAALTDAKGFKASRAANEEKTV